MHVFSIDIFFFPQISVIKRKYRILLTVMWRLSFMSKDNTIVLNLVKFVSLYIQTDTPIPVHPVETLVKFALLYIRLHTVSLYGSVGNAILHSSLHCL